MTAVKIGEDVIQEVVRRILSVISPERIILFGSASTGRMTKDSDVDILVIESGLRDSREESLRLREALRGLGWAFDVIVMDKARFTETKDVIGGIAYPANKYGKIVYEAG
jgi:predicted nucleotidyltransferase